MKAGRTELTTLRPDASRRRALFVSALLCAWMLVIGGRLVQLQAFRHEELADYGRAQQQLKAAVKASRGLILDRSGRELASSVEVESFFAVPSEVEDARATAEAFAAAAGADGSRLAARLEAAKAEGPQAKGGKFVWLARKLDREQAGRVRALNLKGVYTRAEYERRYPSGKLAAHVVGFVGQEEEEGLGGVELIQDAALKGETGRRVLEGDARRKSYASLSQDPRPGQSVVLTLDQTIQHYAENALAAALARAPAKSATAIVLEPRTGEVLALANAPSFDPNEAKKVSDELRKNHALQDIYEPGSTFKIVAFSAALEEKLAKPDDQIDCQMGSITIAGRVVRDHTAYGTLTLTEALAKSSNVAAIKLGLRVGDARMHDYITRFGFGARTGVELPGETRGILRPVARWQKSSIGSIAIGQEIGVTPLQVASAFAAIANDGVRVAPHLVKELRGADGSVVSRPEPESRRVVSAETARTVRGMLEMVTLKGTAKLAQLEGYTAAGKTGTAQKIDPKTGAYPKTKHVASFVGFAPVENPAVVIIVVVDEPVGAYHGGDTAAPIFRDIAAQVLPYLNVLPDTEIKPEDADGARLLAQASGSGERVDESNAEESPAVAPTPRQLEGAGEVLFAEAGARGVLMPDLRGVSVREAMRVCALLGLELEARGDGRAHRQSPAAGESVEPGQVVRVEFGRSD